jgi:hypothetical protein
LANEDSNAVNEDVEFLRSVEKNAFELILSRESDENYELNEEQITSSLQNLINSIDKYANGLLITDQHVEGITILQTPVENINTLHGHFDYVIVNLNKRLMSMDNEKTIKLLIKIFSYIKTGGMVFIPKSTYDYLPGARKGLEALIKNSNLNIEVPPFGIKNAVIASKR